MTTVASKLFKIIDNDLKLDQQLVTSIFKSWSGVVLIIDDQINIKEAFKGRTVDLNFDNQDQLLALFGPTFTDQLFGRISNIKSKVENRGNEKESDFEFSFVLNEKIMEWYASVSGIEGKDLFCVFLFDTTEIKRKERELVADYAISKIGSWRFEVATGLTVWSKELYDVYEVVYPQPIENLNAIYLEKTVPEERVILESSIADAIRSGSLFSYKHRVLLDGGLRIKYIRGGGRVIKDERGNPIFVVGTFQDETEHVTLQNQLEIERAKATHSAKLASLGEMSAGVAHEINNPLAIIAGNLSLLPKFKDTPEKFESKIEAIKKSVNRIDKIVKGLKKFSRTSDGIVRREENLQSIVGEALLLTESNAKKNNVEIILQVPSDAKIICDPVEIEQVLINLVNNAIDAVASEFDKWVQITCVDDGSKVILQVIDSGPGISDDIEVKLFQPFFTTKSVGHGTGLGLSIVKGILDQHKATIMLNKSVSNTCFEIQFPKDQTMTDGMKNAV